MLGGAGPHTGAVPLQQVKGSTRAEVRKQLPGLLVAEQPEGPLPKWAVAVGGEALGHLENCSCLQFRVRSECVDADEPLPAEPEGKDQLVQLSLVVSVAVLERGAAVRSRAAAPIAHLPSEQPSPCVRRSCAPQGSRGPPLGRTGPVLGGSLPQLHDRTAPSSVVRCRPCRHAGSVSAEFLVGLPLLLRMGERTPVLAAVVVEMLGAAAAAAAGTACTVDVGTPFRGTGGLA